MVALEALLAEAPQDPPCGPNLEYDPDFMALDQAAIHGLLKIAHGQITSNLEQQKDGKNEKDLHVHNHFDGIDSLYSAPDSGGD